MNKNMRRLRKDDNGSFAYLAGIGILLIIVIFVLPAIMYDSAEDAWSKVKDDTFSAGTSVSFVGEVTSLQRDVTYTGLGSLRVKGFEAPIFFRNNDISIGDEVTVDGKYFGASAGGNSLGYVSGGISAYSPADVDHPYWKVGFCSTIFLIAIIMVIVGIIGYLTIG